jgi:succinate-acetate transporter protein
VVFVVVWLTFTSRALEDFQQADALITASGFNPWIAACSAWWLAGKAFDQLYPPADGK